MGRAREGSGGSRQLLGLLEGVVQCRLQPGSHAREEAAEQGARCPSELTASVPCQLVSFSGSTLLEESSEMDGCMRACVRATPMCHPHALQVAAWSS